MPGTLYVVATPIGNLEDFTFRAVRMLKEVDLIACEDTRHTRHLLTRYGISTPLMSYHEHNEQRRVPELLKQLQSGKSVALVSDAGTPVLSDPGYALIQAAVDAGMPVVPIPGPSAITVALSVAALPTDRFLFLGFLPRKTGERRRALQEVAGLPYTLVLFEAPHRLERTLLDVQAVLGNRHIVMMRELTKKFEEIVRGTVSDVLDHIGMAPPRGEITLAIEGAAAMPPASDPAAELKALLARGIPAKEAVREVVQRHHMPKRAAYQLALQITGKRRTGDS